MGNQNPLGDRIESLVKQSPQKFTVYDLAIQFKQSEDAVRGILKRRHLKHLVLAFKDSESNEANRQLALLKECEKYGVDISNVKYFWHKSERVSMFVVAQNRPSYEEVRDGLIREMRKYAPIYPKIERKKTEEKHLLIIDPADIHVGKLSVKTETGFEYNIEKAVKDAEEGVIGLLEKAKGFEIDKILLIIGNDALHADTPRGTTTKGTLVDTDGQWHESFRAAREMYVRIIEILLQVANVDIIYNPSNHDYASGFMLADAVYCWFHNCKQVKFDVSIRHRKYYQYGKNLIATTHGDGAKNMDMPILMAQEADKMWSDTKHRYIYQHHLHHKVKTSWQSVKDYPGITLEVLRSPSAPDGWHDRNGFVGTPRAIEGFLHNKEKGQVARLTHILD